MCCVLSDPRHSQGPDNVAEAALRAPNNVAEAAFRAPANVVETAVKALAPGCNTDAVP